MKILMVLILLLVGCGTTRDYVEQEYHCWSVAYNIDRCESDLFVCLHYLDRDVMECWDNVD